MESQLKLNDERLELVEKFKQLLPDVYTTLHGMLNVVYKDGALSNKVKRLMSLTIALRAGCTNCILAQTKRALEAGATKDEFLETIAVEVAMSGSTGIAESLRVLKQLDELGEL
jgi:AhpD family alkylhydroperoxidase